MQVIFLAEKECMLTVNGAYFGVVDGFERRAELNTEDGLFCELRCAGYLPISFRFDEAFLFSPPPKVELYFFKGGVAVRCRDFVKDDPTLSVLWRETVCGVPLTLCMQGRLQLRFGETGTADLPEGFETCKPYPLGEEILLEGETCFAVFSREGELKLLSEGKISERDGTLKAEIPFFDSMGHTAVIERRGDRLLSCVIRSRFEPSARTFALALFESVLIGADVSPFLAENLQSKASSLKNFLGKFTSVVPTGDDAVTGLVYPRKPRVFDVRYFRVTLENGKISNIMEE